MRLLLALLVAACLAAPASAESLVALRTVKARTIIAAEDLTTVAAAIPGALQDPAEIIGREARVTLYAGRPIRAEDLGAPTLVDRNQTVILIFQAGGLSIRTDGRALDRAGAGEQIRVMNLSSRQTVTGTVAADGTIRWEPAKG